MSSFNQTDSLASLGMYITRITLPIAMILGLVGNILNIFVLTRPRLFKHPSSRYFLAMSINNLISSIFVPIIDLLAVGYNIIITEISLPVCRTVRYISDLSGILALYFIVLASFDRVLISSSNIICRRCSSVKNAQWAIIILVSLFAILYINTILLTEIDLNDRVTCTLRARTIYHRIYSWIQVILFAIIAPVLLISFGTITINNTTKAFAKTGNVTSNRKTERQLGFMLLVQVTTHLLLNIPVSLFYLIYLFSSPSTYSAKIQFYFIMARHIHQFSHVTPFFLYTLTSETFKKELSGVGQRCTGYTSVKSTKDYQTRDDLTDIQLRHSPPESTS